MRISDWSSDVCSSDLLLPSFSCSVPGQFLPFLMDAAAFQFAQLRIVAHSSHKLIEHLKESPAQQQDKKDNGGIQQWRKGMRLKEIGRASCRERVCQYVYISVDAVPLKKKTKNT